MTSAAIRAQLHHYIDVADDAGIANIYNIIETESGKGKYSPTELAEFYKRLEQYNSGEMPGFTMEEAHSYVRQNKKSK